MQSSAVLGICMHEEVRQGIHPKCFAKIEWSWHACALHWAKAPSPQMGAGSVKQRAVLVAGQLELEIDKLRALLGVIEAHGLVEI